MSIMKFISDLYNAEYSDKNVGCFLNLVLNLFNSGESFGFICVCIGAFFLRT